MNKLELCQRLQKEVGGPTITTTIAQTGRIGSMVSWIDSAYEDIQNRSKLWLFLLTEFSFDTIVGTSNYTKAALGFTELGMWNFDTIRVYLDTITDENYLSAWEWWAFRDSRLMGGSRSVTGRPTDFAVKQDKSLSLWPVPDDEYTITGEYFKRAQTMTADASEPLIPLEFQMAIVWRAAMFFAADQEATTLYSHAEKEFKRIYSALELDQQPPIGTHEALC